MPELRSRATPESTFPIGRKSDEASVADHLLSSLERLVKRHRTLSLGGGETAELHSGLHTELISAEVTHELELARSAVQRRLHPAR
jgi:hypothetical protein